jgi:hypothetical protein
LASLLEGALLGAEGAGLLAAVVAGGALAVEAAVLRVTRSAVSDGEALGLGAVERCEPEELVNCVSKAGVEGDSATALIDMSHLFLGIGLAALLYRPLLEFCLVPLPKKW